MGRRASLPKHLSQSASETSLAERRRSQVSRYLETDDHKSEFATKLRDVRDRERTVSGESPSPLRNSVGLPRQTSLRRGSQGSGGGKSNTTTPDRDSVDLPPTDEVLSRRERRASALDMVLASSLTLSLDTEETDPIEHFKESPPQEQPKDAAKPAEQPHRSPEKPLPIPKEVLARTAAGRNLSMGGLEIIREIKVGRRCFSFP